MGSVVEHSTTEIFEASVETQKSVGEKLSRYIFWDEGSTPSSFIQNFCYFNSEKTTKFNTPWMLSGRRCSLSRVRLMVSLPPSLNSKVIPGKPMPDVISMIAISEI